MGCFSVDLEREERVSIGKTRRSLWVSVLVHFWFVSPCFVKVVLPSCIHAHPFSINK